VAAVPEAQDVLGATTLLHSVRRVSVP